MKYGKRIGVVRWTLLGAGIVILAACGQGTHLGFLSPQGPVAEAQRRHFFEAMAILVVFVAVPVFVLTPWFALRYRYRATKSRYTPRWRFSWLLEITAWSGPVVIVALLAIIVWRDTHALDPYTPLASAAPVLRVQVIGYDWKWLFVYPNEGVASIGILALPAGRPVALELTSATVMQSFLIPALGGQIYAMGGMVTQLHLEAARPGRFMGENTMYNGDGFHQQQFTAVAMTPAMYDAWVSKVRETGIPLNRQTLQIVSQPNTRAQLVADLPHPNVSSDGNIYLTGATAELFPAVVKATMDGASRVLEQSK